MHDFSTEGLVGNGRVGPQVLSFRSGQWVLDTSDYICTDGDSSLVCPLDNVFDQPREPVIVFGKPNVSMIIPDIDGAWKRFAAYMCWRGASHWASTRGKDDSVTQGRVQAGIWCEVRGLPTEAKDLLRTALMSLVNTRKASCAHTLALALARAGFVRGSGKSLKHIYRPSRLARILWTEGLRWRKAQVQLRWIQAGPRSVSDHFVAAWLMERRSPQRLVQKQYCPGEHHSPAPSFPPRADTIPLQDLWGSTDEPRVRVGISVPSKTGANLAYALGQQPIFVVELPRNNRLHETGKPLKAFPGKKLDRLTWLKKNVLFRKLVVRVVHNNVARRIDWVGEVPVSSVAKMLQLSNGRNREGAFAYNYVATSSHLFLSRITNNVSRTDVLGRKLGALLDTFNTAVEWVMSKHVLVAGYSMDVRLSGELWAYRSVNGDIRVPMNNNSGTYKPSIIHLILGVNALKKIFPTKFEVMIGPENLNQ